MGNKNTLIKILLVSDVSISEVIGGAERVLFEQSTRLAKKNYEVHILTRKLPIHNFCHENMSNVREWRYEFSFQNNLKSLISNFKNAQQLFEILQKKYNFNFINFHQPFSAFGVVQSPLSQTVPKLYTCHSLAFEEYISRNHEKTNTFGLLCKIPNIILRKQIEKRVLNKSDKITVLSQFTKDKLQRIYRIPSEKVLIVHGGVKINRFHPSRDKILLRKKLKIPVNKTIIFTVRNLVKRMGLENLILATKKISANVNNIYVVIGGDGPLKSELISLTETLGLKQSIHFTGFIPENKLPNYYQMADLFVLPTKELEGFGLVTLEAMASGLPVVGTPIGGTKEILKRFDSSFLFRGADPASIAELISEKIKLIRQNPHRWQEISNQCRKFAEKNYLWKNNIESIEELISKMV